LRRFGEFRLYFKIKDEIARHFDFLVLSLYVSVVKFKKKIKTVLFRRVTGRLQSLVSYSGLQDVVTLDVRDLDFSMMTYFNTFVSTFREWL
jgi:hypothetical protein